MNVIEITREDLNKFLDETGWSACRLAREAGLATQTITRVSRGPRKRLGVSAALAVAPFMFGSLRPDLYRQSTEKQGSEAAA